MSLIVGPSIGPDVGLAVGINADSGSSPPSVPTDGPSSFRFPSTTDHFTTLGIASPTSAWMCQEASGTLADSFGGLTLSNGGTAPTYQSAVAGYSRVSILLADAATTLFLNASAPDPATVSQMMFVYGQLNATPAATRAFFGFGVATAGAGRIETTPRFRAQFGGALATGTASPAGAVYLFGLQRDVTAGANRGAWDDAAAALLTPASTALAGQRVAIGGNGASCPPMNILAAYYWTGAEAEGLANFRDKWQALSGQTALW